ncbi:lysylphosphatidylglycerol synthase transmembrane domain-containing protein [Corynebacterium auris]|uniref:lysylphosphatidylglycerol synthase transmembrane domain-containing protein n=1 Tax=Corynebacterium auris TaxID=44750 RepID=UPI0025B30A9A|nr:YbhN family protein [Corynebacterium auris]WJY68959.1 hypothetical protein CAURIS_10440 [Corynebacterium auris]
MATPATTARERAAKWARWLLPLVALVLALFFLRDQLPFLGEAWDALARASVGPVVAAVVVAYVSIVAMSGVRQVLLNSQGHIVGFPPCNRLSLASNAWSTTVPGGPAISAWFTFNVHRSWGASVGLCGWFIVISSALSTVWLVAIGVLSVAVLGADLSLPALAASLAASVGVALALYWVARNPNTMQRAVRHLPGRIERPVADVVGQIAAVRMSTGAFASSAVLSLLNRVLDAATYYFAALAITDDPALRSVMLAFVMTKLAGTAQVTPGGVGTVDAVGVGVLAAGGFSLGDATAITLLYRLISFVLITAIGWVYYFIFYAGRGYVLGAPATPER